jgi:transcriptional regulator GlxA family with amidase domain
MIAADSRHHPNWFPRDDGPVTIGFFLTADFPLLAFAAALDPLRQANRLTKRKLFQWVMISEDGEPMTNSAGFSVSSDHSIANAARCELVVVCAGVDPFRHYQPRVLAWLRKLNRQGVQLGAVSTGAYLLARAGLLEGRRCTVHWENFSDFQEEFPNVLASSAIFVVDGPFITSSGGTVTLDMMLHVVQAFYGQELAVAISDQFNHPQIRSQGEAQRMTSEARFGITNPKLSNIVDTMQNTIQAPLSVSVLARMAGLSSRQMERLFLTHFGKTPVGFYTELRMERAFELVSRTSLPVETIARHCGYRSVVHFARRYRMHFQASPAQTRNAKRGTRALRS